MNILKPAGVMTVREIGNETEGTNSPSIISTLINNDVALLSVLPLSIPRVTSTQAWREEREINDIAQLESGLPSSSMIVTTACEIGLTETVFGELGEGESLRRKVSRGSDRSSLMMEIVTFFNVSSLVSITSISKAS